MMHNMDGLVSANDGALLTSRWLMAAHRLEAAHSKSRFKKKKKKGIQTLLFCLGFGFFSYLLSIFQ